MKRIGIILGTVLCGCILQTANAETTKFYVDGALYDTTTCTAGGNTTLPTNPTPPTGYVFAGWEYATYDFSTLNAQSSVTHYYAKCRKSDGSDVCFRDNNTQRTCDTSYADLAQKMWKGDLGNIVIYGDTLCSVTSGTANVKGTPSETQAGGHCWCRAIGYKASGSSKMYASSVSTPWVYDYGYSNATGCDANCAEACGNFWKNVLAFRKAVLNQ